MINRIRASALLRVAALGAGLAVAASGSAQITTYGDNSGGQLTIPSGVTKYDKVLNGDQNAAVLNLDGSIRIWGAVGTGFTNGTTPRGFIDASMGPNNIIGLKSDGTVSVFGYPYYGAANVPAGLKDVVKVSAGGEHMMALKADGSVVTWGSNSNGERNVPAGLHNSVAIAAGYGFSAALQDDGTVQVWGSINGTYSGVAAVSAGSLNLMMLKTDGTVQVIGSGFFGALNVPAGLSNVVEVACAGYHCMALTSDGTVAAWGWNQYGQCSGPNGFVGADDIVPGSGSSMVVQGAPLSLQTSAAVLTGGSTAKVTGKVLLPAAAVADTVVTLAASDSEVTVPSTVTVHAGATYATFPITSSTVSATKRVRIAASIDGLAASLLVELRPISVASIKLASTAVYGGSSGDVVATVTLSATPAAPLTVSLSSSDTGYATVAATVDVPALSKSTTFVVHTVSVAKLGYATIEATAGGVSKTAKLKVMPELGISSFSITSTLYGNQDGLVKLTLRYPAGPGGAYITLSSSGPGLNLPNILVLSEGTTSVTFPVQVWDVSSPSTVTVKASFGATEPEVAVALNPMRITGVTVASTVVGGSTVNGTVTLNKVVNYSTDVTVTVVSGGAYAIGIPVTITIPAGAKSAPFSFATTSVTANRKLQLTFEKIDSISKSLTITP